jgi:hypothetical protein
MKLFPILFSALTILSPANGYLMPKFVISNLEHVGEFHDRLDQAYQEWCDTYQTEPDESRRKIFACNFFQAESYTNKTGGPLQLNEFADRTAAEYNRFQEMQETVPVEEVEVTTSNMNSLACLGSLSTKVGPVDRIDECNSQQVHRRPDETFINDNIGPQDCYEPSQIKQQKSELLQSMSEIRLEMEQALITKIQTWEDSFQQTPSNARRETELETTKIYRKQATLGPPETDRTSKSNKNKIDQSYVFQRNILQARLKVDHASRLRTKKFQKYAFHRNLLEVRLKRKRRDKTMSELTNQMDLLVSTTTKHLNKLAQEMMPARSLKKTAVKAPRRKYEVHRQLLKVSRAKKQLERQAETVRFTWLYQPRDYSAVDANVSAALQVYDAAIRTALEEKDWHGAAVACDLAGEHVLQLDDSSNALEDYASLSRDLYAQSNISNQLQLLKVSTWLYQPRDYSAVDSNVSAALQVYDAAIRTALEEEDWHGAAVASDLAGEHVLQLDDSSNALEDYASLSRDLYAQSNIFNISNQLHSSSSLSWATTEPDESDFDLLEQAIASQVFSNDVLVATKSTTSSKVTGAKPIKRIKNKQS